MRSQAVSGLLAQIADLKASIDAETDASDHALSHVGFERGRSHHPLPQDLELRRQLNALRERVVRALSQLVDPRELRAELATLLFFARALRADARTWQAAAGAALREREREEMASRRERERLAAECEALMQRRDSLQAEIRAAADRLAAHEHGECRTTLPVINLAPGITVGSISVSAPKKPLRAPRRWLVTLSESRDGAVVRGP